MPASRTSTRKPSVKKSTASRVKVGQGGPNRNNSSLLTPRVALPLMGMFALVATALVFRSFAATVPAGFVYRDGKNLMLNGAKYQFVGFNAFGITGCEGSSWSRAQLDGYFAQLPPASVTRFWAFKSGGTAIIDQVVASAEAHNQKVAPVLDNDLADCNNEGAKNASWYASGYKSVYLPWAQSVASKYKSSPAIAYWEMINEAGQSSGEGSLNGSTMNTFYNTVAGAIKANDPNHLVATGDNAEFNYSGGASAYKTAASGANVDILSLHDYEYDYVKNAPVVSSHFGTTSAAASSLGKPIVIGEMNLSACNGITTTSRAPILKSRIAAYLSQGASGVLLWNRSQTLYGTSCNGENYIIAGTDPAIAMIQKYSIAGIVATPPTSSIPVSGGSNGSTGTGAGSGGTTTPPTQPSQPTKPTTPTTPPAQTVDKTAPSKPSNLKATRITSNSVTISWKASTDNVGVKSYNIFRNGKRIANQTSTSLTVYGLRSNTKYTFTVQAYDAAGNTSANAQISVTTSRNYRWWW